MNPAFIYLGVGAAAAYGYASGRLTNLFDNFKSGSDNNNNQQTHNNNNNSSQQQHMPQQLPQIIVTPSSNNSRPSYLLPLSCACFIGLGGYYWYISSSSTKKVIGKVEETSAETQDLVQKCDENNIKRFNVLDSKNDDRSQDLELNIRTEQRSGFHVIQEQLYGLTQVCIHTLSVLANNDNSNDNNNNPNDTELFNKKNEKLHAYVHKAQQMSDTILDDDHQLKIRANNMNDIKAEIENRNINNPDIIINNNTTTKGGNTPGNDDNNAFDIDHNQQPYITNISYKDNIKKKDDKNITDNNQYNFDKILNKIAPFKIIFNNYNNFNKKSIIIYSLSGTSLVIFTYWTGSKLINYITSTSTTSKSNQQ